MTFWTSEYLVEKLDELKDEDVLIELAEEGHGISAEEEKLEKLILALIDQSLDSPLPQKLRDAVGRLRGNKDALEGWVDECRCRDFLKNVRHMVQRARRFAPLFVDETPEPVVADMWRESVRS